METRERIKEIFLEELVESSDGDIMLDGKWYKFKLDCDGLAWLLDGIQGYVETLIAEREKEAVDKYKEAIYSNVQDAIMDWEDEDIQMILESIDNTSIRIDK